MEKNMENQMATGIIQGMIGVKGLQFQNSLIEWVALGPLTFSRGCAYTYISLIQNDGKL